MGQQQSFLSLVLPGHNDAEYQYENLRSVKQGGVRVSQTRWLWVFGSRCGSNVDDLEEQAREVSVL